MTTHSSDENLKRLFDDLAKTVSGLPQHLQEAAFSILLHRALGSPSRHHDQEKTKAGGAQDQHPAPPAVGDSFGEFYGEFPSDLKEEEKLLAAAAFAEAQSDDRSFTVDTANVLLRDIGEKLSNSSMFAKRLATKKLIFSVGKAGKRTFKYRVHRDGHKLLKELKERKT